MTTYNTGNALGSSDARDLYDNAENFDNAINGPGLTWVDRRGVTRPTWQGAIEDGVTAAELAASDGASKVGYLPAGAGAVSTDVQSKLRELVSVKDFGAVGDGVTDDTAAIQAALTYAGSLSISDASFPGYGYVVKGGATVCLPAGCFVVTGTLTVPQNVSLEGDGKHASVIKSSYDGHIVQNNGTPTVTGTYDCTGMAFRNFSIIGDRTKTSQIGLALLRLTAASIENVAVSKCGSHGVAMYQCSINSVSNLESIYNVGHGLLMQGGFNTWADRTANGYPSNANVFEYFRGLQNDGAGLYFGNGTNGNIFVGANCEYNYYTAGNNAGYNVQVETDSYSPNVFYGLWTEGPVKAHVYLACSDISVLLKLVDWKHFGNGTAGNVDRALIMNTGSAMVVNASATADSYKTISGSNAPYRIQNKAASILRLVGSYGASVSGLALVEDGTGAKTGLYNNLKQDNAAIDGSMYGPVVFYNDQGTDGVAYRTDVDSHPWYQSRAYYRDVLLGDGSSAPDAGFRRVVAGQIGPRSGDFFNVGSNWDDSHLIMGGFHLWVTSGGVLRIKFGAPTGETDGTVVGTQT